MEKAGVVMAAEKTERLLAGVPLHLSYNDIVNGLLIIKESSLLY
jgi:hypothetical protein